MTFWSSKNWCDSMIVKKGGGGWGNDGGITSYLTLSRLSYLSSTSFYENRFFGKKNTNYI